MAVRSSGAEGNASNAQCCNAQCCNAQCVGASLPRSPCALESKGGGRRPDNAQLGGFDVLQHCFLRHSASPVGGSPCGARQQGARQQAARAFGRCLASHSPSRAEKERREEGGGRREEGGANCRGYVCELKRGGGRGEDLWSWRHMPTARPVPRSLPGCSSQGQTFEAREQVNKRASEQTSSEQASDQVNR